MRALWSDRPNCSHNVSQKVKRSRRFSELWSFLVTLWSFLLTVRSSRMHAIELLA